MENAGDGGWMKNRKMLNEEQRNGVETGREENYRWKLIKMRIMRMLKK